MATDNEIQRNDCCVFYPDFAAMCMFIEKFGDLLGLLKLNIKHLQEGFEDHSQETPQLISELHVYLLRRIRKNVPTDKWEKHLAQFCYSYNHRHAWELEDNGYSKLQLSTKMAIIRNLLEAQFDSNQKFQDMVKAEIPEEQMRLQCYGRDKDGLCYWLIQDEEFTINIYRVEQDDEDGSSWQVVAQNRDELEQIIECLREGKTIPGLPQLSETVSRCDTPLSTVSTATPVPFVKSATNTPSKLATVSNSSLERKAPSPNEITEASPLKDNKQEKEKEEMAAEPIKTETTEEIPVIKSEVKIEFDDNNQVRGVVDKEPEGTSNHQEKMVQDDIEEAKKQLEDATPDSQADNALAHGKTSSSNDANQLEATEETTTTGKGPSTADMEIPHGDTSIQNSAETSQLMEDAQVQNGQEGNVGEEMMQTIAKAVESSSEDSDDNIPLSQLKPTCVLMSRARRSLMRAKKEHEKRKFKETMKKKKEKLKKNKKTAAVTEAASATPLRSSGRERKPVYQEVDTSDEELYDSSDVIFSDDDYFPKGRNARRQAKRSGVVLPLQEEVVEEIANDDTPCTLCGKYTQPHLILLCDKCDAGWHTGCLKPPLFYIPDDDWFCPSCEQATLLEKLEAHLVSLDEAIKAHEAKLKRLERQEKYALSHGINPENIIQPKPEQRVQREKKEKKFDEYDYDSWEEDYGYSASKRSCRQRSKVNYNFDEYEKIMNKAIKNSENEDPTILPGTNSTLISKPKPARSKGKDISNLLSKAGIQVSSDEETDDSDAKKDEDESDAAEEKPQTINSESKENKNGDNQKKKKKRRKFTSDNEGSAGDTDDDYHFSDDEAMDEEAADEVLSDDDVSSGDWLPGGKKGRRRRKQRDDVKSFICDDEEDSEDETRRKRPAKRQTRTSAAAQAAIRRKRTFGFSSSEESLASTPSSSSSEEEKATRIKNKWNSSNTYGGKRNKLVKDEKGEKKKKKRKVVAYNSDESTVQESESSGDEYIPKPVIEKTQGERKVRDTKKSVVLAQESDNETEDEKEKAIKKSKKRLESSSESEANEKDVTPTDKKQEKTALELEHKTAKEQREKTAKEQREKTAKEQRERHVDDRKEETMEQEKELSAHNIDEPVAETKSVEKNTEVNSAKKVKKPVQKKTSLKKNTKTAPHTTKPTETHGSMPPTTVSTASSLPAEKPLPGPSIRPPLGISSHQTPIQPQNPPGYHQPQPYHMHQQQHQPPYQHIPHQMNQAYPSNYPYNSYYPQSSGIPSNSSLNMPQHMYSSHNTPPQYYNQSYQQPANTMQSQQPYPPPNSHIMTQRQQYQQANYQPMPPPAVSHNQSTSFMVDNLLQSTTSSPSKSAAAPAVSTISSLSNDIDEEDEIASYITMASFVTGGSTDNS